MSQQAVAGESYVRNSDTRSHSSTTTDLRMNSTDWSYGSRDWSNWAEKIYIDGSFDKTYKTKGEFDVSLTGGIKNGYFDGYQDASTSTLSATAESQQVTGTASGDANLAVDGSATGTVATSGHVAPVGVNITGYDSQRGKTSTGGYHNHRFYDNDSTYYSSGSYDYTNGGGSHNHSYSDKFATSGKTTPFAVNTNGDANLGVNGNATGAVNLAVAGETTPGNISGTVHNPKTSVAGAIGGDIHLGGGGSFGSKTTVSEKFDQFTVHLAGSQETGWEEFGNDTTVGGTIFTYSTEKTTAHESAAGNR